MNLYYRSVIDEIERLMDESKFQQAKEILDRELSIPYIPPLEQQRLEELNAECSANLIRPAASINLDRLDALIDGSPDQQEAAVELMSRMNLRNLESQVSHLLGENVPDFIRGKMIEALMAQKIDTEYEMEKDGLHIAFIPSLIRPASEDETVQKAAEWIRKWFSSSRPDLEMFAMALLDQEVCTSRPFDLSGLDDMVLARSIAEQVFLALKAEDEYTEFLKDSQILDGPNYILNIVK